MEVLLWVQRLPIVQSAISTSSIAADYTSAGLFIFRELFKFAVCNLLYVEQQSAKMTQSENLLEMQNLRNLQNFKNVHFIPSLREYDDLILFIYCI